jgi:hypothetical protein
MQLEGLHSRSVRNFFENMDMDTDVVKEEGIISLGASEIRGCQDG